jgi:POT family proton-dependent oligopeptide transporter
METPTADSPIEPDITHVNPVGGDMWFGHPRQLARLFTTEAMERFGNYGMRALLTLYLAQNV